MRPDLTRKSARANASQSSLDSGLDGDEDNVTESADECGDHSGDLLLSTWDVIIDDWGLYKNRKRLIKKLIHSGIPNGIRDVVWPLLCGAKDSPATSQYAEYHKATSIWEEQISLDVGRTYPEHGFYKMGCRGQKSLFNVLKAYSLHDKDVGFCQGLPFIAGILLLEMSEEMSFAVLVHMMDELNLREFFHPSMVGFQLACYQLENLIKESMPELYSHFQSQSFYTSYYATNWFLTMFCRDVSLTVGQRVMDAFLLDGLEIIFRLALAILSMSKTHLLSLKMEGMFKYLQKEIPVSFDLRPDIFFLAASNVNYNKKKMRQWEIEYWNLPNKADNKTIQRLNEMVDVLRGNVSNLDQEANEAAALLASVRIGKLEKEAENCDLKMALQASRQQDAKNTARIGELERQIRDVNERMLDADEAQHKVNILKELAHCLNSQLNEANFRLKHLKLVNKRSQFPVEMRLRKTYSENRPPTTSLSRLPRSRSSPVLLWPY